MAKYTIKEIELSDEKDLLIGMIVSTEFIKNIILILKDLSLLQSSYARLIASWCINHYIKYEEAPKELIQDIFNSNKESIQDESDVDIIESVIIHLNEKYIEKESQFNVEYYYNKAENYLKSRSLTILSETIKGYTLQGKVKEAESTIATYNRIEKPMGRGIDLLNDPTIFDKMEKETQNSLFSIPGAFGEAMHDVYRGDVISVGGASKRGKSWIMAEIAKYALFDGLKIAVFTLEMKDTIYAKRIFTNLLGETKKKLDKQIEVPYFIKDGDKTIVEYKYVTKEGFNIGRAKRFQQKLKKQVRTGGFKLFDVSSGGTTISEICTTLDNCSYYDGFVPDVVLIDYADIIESDKYAPREELHRINDIWKKMKREIAQKRNCLVITGSQYQREAINNDADISNIAGNIRKFDHVSHWINLNQTKIEKRMGIIRLSVEGRHDDFNSLDEVVCLQCLDIGRPIIDSRWKDEIANYKELVS